MRIIFLIALIFSWVKVSSEELKLGVAVDGFPITPSKLEKIQKEMGVKPKMVVFFLMWSDNNKDPFLNIFDSLKACEEFGLLPCITFEPMYLKNNKEKIIPYGDILSGKYDDYLNAFIFQIKAFKKNVIIRFAHEMNLSRYHWGVDKTKYNKKYPEIYKKMHRYVYNYFKKKEANNAYFAFCPNVDSVPNKKWNIIENYYPGDEYIDVLGIDGYNFGTCATKKNMGWESNWRSFDDIFEKPILELQKLSILKPLIIFEVASASKGGNKELWIENAIVSANKLGVSYLNWFQFNKECDWKISKKQKNILKKYFYNDNKNKDGFLDNLK